MQKLFDEVSSLDKLCYEKFALSEDILMEHAAQGIANYIRLNFAKGSKIIVVCGSGNNGADGMALARLVHLEFNVELYLAKTPKSKMAILQAKRTKSIGVKTINKITNCDILLDAYVGTGFNGNFDESSTKLMKKLNSIVAFKIACDIPSGIKKSDKPSNETFVADVTLTMGALKKSMFLDYAKDFIGTIKVINLGLPRSIYEKYSDWNLLDLDDLELPFRDKKNSHKGNFGHLAVISGEKKGASLMSAKAALKFGAGLVTLVSFTQKGIPEYIMSSHTLPLNTTAIALGMGLGNIFSRKELSRFLDNEMPLVVDADIFYMKEILNILKREYVVLTPHPKEFVSLLKLTNLADINVEELQIRRFKYVEMFCKKYVKVVLLLKGSNVIIGKNNKFFINPHGTSALAKGGSGDVLSGLIGSLLAQGHKILNATVNASLAHTKLAQNYTGTDFSLTPDDLIKGIGNL